jgi:hypothetical protein
LENAIVGVDLADEKQMVVVYDHDSRVLARRTFRCRARDLAKALDWAAPHAHFRRTDAGRIGHALSIHPEIGTTTPTAA